jgi:cytochrome c oxidase subunit 2
MPNISKLLCHILVALAFVATIPASADEPVIPADEFVYCTVCHGAQMRGNVLLKAPRVSEMEAWYVKRQMEAFSSGWRGSHGDDVAGMEMRPMAAILTGDEIDEVASYVSRVSSNLPAATVSGDVAKGASLYTSCAVCHGANAEGNEGLHTPSLVGRNDWYLATQLRNFRNGIRGSHPADTYGTQMRAATGVLTDDEAINNVVAYLNTLKPE